MVVPALSSPRQKFLATEDGKNMLAGNKRAESNILGIAERRRRTSAGFDGAADVRLYQSSMKERSACAKGDRSGEE